VKNFLAYTLRRLGTDYVDIYRPGPIFRDAHAVHPVSDLQIELVLGALTRRRSRSG
jgi:hypothetical protein